MIRVNLVANIEMSPRGERGGWITSEMQDICQVQHPFATGIVQNVPRLFLQLKTQNGAP